MNSTVKRTMYQGVSYEMAFTLFGGDALIEIIHNGERAMQLVGGSYVGLALRAWSKRDMKTYVLIFRKAARHARRH
jgi:hypothetical protein